MRIIVVEEGFSFFIHHGLWAQDPEGGQGLVVSRPQSESAGWPGWK